MRQLSKYLALLMLVVLTVPSFLFLAGKMDLPTVKTIMLLATILWFSFAGYWMWNETDKQ